MMRLRQGVNTKFILEFKQVFTGVKYSASYQEAGPTGYLHKTVRRAMNTLAKTRPEPVSLDNEPVVKPHYLESLHLVERLHRRLLDIIKDEFERRGRDDVNSVQALLLYNIGDKELTASELRTRGYYLGSNVSYNVKKLVEMGYLHHARSRVDRRAVRISLTDKGRQVHDIVKGLYDKHARTIEPIGGISGDDFQRLNQALMRLERFWADQIRYRL